MADEPCDDNREQEGGIAPKNEHGFTAESAHASRLIGSRASPDSVTDRSGSHLGHIASAIPLATRMTFSLSADHHRLSGYPGSIIRLASEIASPPKSRA